MLRTAVLTGILLSTVGAKAEQAHHVGKSATEIQQGAWPALIAAEAGGVAFGAGYSGSAMAAWAVNFGDGVGCAAGAGGGGLTAGECSPVPKMGALYVPLVGPIAYLFDESRPKSRELDVLVAVLGTAQLAGVVAIGWGILELILGKSNIGRSHPSVSVIPRADASSAGIELVLAF